jgi:hypothetical protein
MCVVVGGKSEVVYFHPNKKGEIRGKEISH